MNLLSIENMTKGYGERVLFDKVNFGIDEEDKIGLIGINGTGKSTFLKIIAGLENSDSGKVIIGSGVHIEYLPQNPVFYEGSTVIEQIFKGHSPVMKVLREYGECLQQLQKQPADTSLQKKMITLSQQMDACNAWQLENDAKTILTKLGITDYLADVSTLSGGQRKRIALAGVLINPADLLILDEPTNHIDNDTVLWLEQYLDKRKGALLMVTHDRYFLDRVTGRIIEIDKGRLYSYVGNYSRFIEIKTEREEQLEASEQKRKNLLRNELEWIKRGAKARTTKQKARIARFEKLSAEKIDITEDKLAIAVGKSRLGRKIIQLEYINKSFEQGCVIRDFSYTLLKDDRIGIVGPNGSGKSTLLNIIANRIEPDYGTVEKGETVKIGYFSQENNREMKEDMKVINYIKEAGEYLPTSDGGSISASQMLERFLFPPSIQWIPITKLSGGEKRRLCLLRILMKAPNVLLLDEPTNDLDIQTLTILEDYLDSFQGAVIIVSHDRYFIDRLTEKIFAFEGNGVIRSYICSYSEYLERRRQEEKESSKKDNNSAIPKKSSIDKRVKERSPRFTFKEQQEFEQIDEIIAHAERELEEITAEINKAGSDYQRLQGLLKEQEEQERRLDELLERWTYLNELAEIINKNK